ncbi:lytic murein transglycosylase [Micromonospora sp. NPDC049240]|uniref:lytic transglycosylase domain-containing protein n=1 Tax=Micromonospora sp. NPDC049240 TaxID=3155151 RepID=UPI0033CE0E16
MVDGERRATARPLRPAAPPDGGAGPVPGPRRGEPGPPAKPAPPADSAAKPARAAEATPAPDATPAPEVTPTPEATSASGATPSPEVTPSSGATPSPEVTPSSGTTSTTEATSDPVVTPATGPASTAEPGVPAAGGRRRRMPFAHAGPVRPGQLAAGAVRATRDWSRRPSGRTTLPALFLLALVGAAVAAGAVLVPAAVRKPEPVAVEATSAPPVYGVPQTGAVPGLTGAPPPSGPPTGLPGTVGPTGTPLPGGPTVNPVLPGGRPADALAGWAQRVGRATDIPTVALQAYGYAELVLAQTHRSCQLSWTTLAAIGFVESGHGSANQAKLGANGVAVPEILGARLDGQGGRSRILDTDQGLLDGDKEFDRALGPMQFIPSTWQEIGADADNDGVRNPHDIDDAALAAGEYLCKGGRNMTIPGDWWGAILSYNDVRRYAQDVFTKADEYGRRSGT